MSSVLVESPAVATQLVFPWCGESSKSVTGVEPLVPASKVAPVSPAKEEIAAGESACDQPSEQLRFKTDSAGVKRIAEPVRIGGVMIKLLKRYGITDEEIAAGLESYANKTRHSVAS